MLSRILSLDISASSTGWAFAFGQARGQVDHGLIKTTPKQTHAERLVYFRNELMELIQMYRPSHVVMEDVYAGLNAKTLVLLAKFSGVAQETFRSMADIEPYIIHTNTVKAFFKAKNKEQVFDIIVDIMEFDDYTYKKHNDITDAVAQLFCYMDHVLNTRIFRTEMPYGYLYGV